MRGAVRGVPLDLDEARAAVPEVRRRRRSSGCSRGSTPSGSRATSRGTASVAAGTEPRAAAFGQTRTRCRAEEDPVPYAQIDDGIELYYELTGPEDGPVIVQFGGGLFGRHNFGFVNDGFRERGLPPPLVRRARLRRLDQPARVVHDRGLGRRRREAARRARARARARPRHVDGRDDRDRVHRARTAAASIATCADVAFAKPDVYRVTLFRVWRRMAEAMPWDDFSDHVTTQAVGAAFLESEEGKDTFAHRPLGDRGQRPVHRAAGLPRDGADGPLAARPADRAARS